MIKKFRKPTRIHSRELDRAVARKRMKDLGVHQPCKKVAGTSFFAEHWREYK